MNTDMKKQTAVEWLYSRLSICTNRDEAADLLYELEEQAKAMEREQIEKAYDDGSESEYQYHINGGYRKKASTYYNEIYGGEQ